jgi:hypothetical protein
MLDTHNPAPRSVVIPSRSNGPDHTCTLTRSRRAGIAGPVGTLYVVCDCSAGRSFRRCWAVRSVARAFGAVAIAR